jgi:hypothetical protein
MCICAPDGTVREETFDTTPTKNHLSILMGGQVTIIGQYEQNNVILLKLQETNEKTPVNTTKLQPPFGENEEIRGPIALVRKDNDKLNRIELKNEFEELINRLQIHFFKQVLMDIQLFPKYKLVLRKIQVVNHLKHLFMLSQLGKIFVVGTGIVPF